MHAIATTSRISAGLVRLLVAAMLAPPLAGCLAPGDPLTPRQQAIMAAAYPILAMDSEAVWTLHYNELVDFGPESIACLMRQPIMNRPAAPDDLAVMLHNSLVRLLASRTVGVPKLTATCLETTLDILHYDLKADGRRLGETVLTTDTPPHEWHSLYPLDFDHSAAAGVDVERDRVALRSWWRESSRESVAVSRRLAPTAAGLWGMLGRRWADRWEYQPEPRAILCCSEPRGQTLLFLATRDYNLTRAACVWLGAQGGPDVRSRLIDLIASPSPIVAHNARFALRYSPDERIRALLEQYE